MENKATIRIGEVVYIRDGWRVPFKRGNKYSVSIKFVELCLAEELMHSLEGLCVIDLGIREMAHAIKCKALKNLPVEFWHFVFINKFYCQKHCVVTRQ